MCAAQDPEKARSLSSCPTDLEVPEEALALEGLGLVAFVKVPAERANTLSALSQ